jgi:hypothetical protein
VTLYEHIAHPHVEARKEAGPVRTEDHRTSSRTIAARVNAKLGLAITLSVGTMWAAYVFTAVALVSLPSAISSHNSTILIAWISSNFLQLVLLPIVIVGQNIQAKAADARADSTYRDAEAIIESARQIAEHLSAQDEHLGVQDQHLLAQDDRLDALADRSAALADQLAALAVRMTPPAP